MELVMGGWRQLIGLAAEYQAPATIFQHELLAPGPLWLL